MLLRQKQRHIEKLENHIAASKKATDYSLERFDLLVISLASGGLVLSVAFVKDLIPNYAIIDLTLLKLSWIFFGSTPVINLFSQVSGYYANKKEILISTNIIREKRNKSVNINIAKAEKWCRILSNTTMLLNGICLASLTLAISLLIIFISNNV